MFLNLPLSPSICSSNSLTNSYSGDMVDVGDVQTAIPINRIFAGYFFAVSNGIKTVVPLVPEKGVHTRLETDDERLKRESQERIKFQLESMRCRQRRQRRNARIARNICLVVRHMELEEHRWKLQNLYSRRDQWRDVSIHKENALRNVIAHVHDLVDALEMSERHVEAVISEREEAQALLANERELAEDAESRRKIAISSLRQRHGQEKQLLLEEVQELQETIRERDYAIAQLNEYCAESVQHIEALDRRIALHESNEAMESFSREVSCTLSEMSAVVVLRNDDRESVEEKMRDLRDGIKDLVREVKTRRKHSHIMSEHIYKLEEERLMWLGDDEEQPAEE